MNNLNRQLNNLKKIEASKEWKSSFKSELFEEEKILFMPVDFQVAVSSIATVCLLFATFSIFSMGPSNRVEPAQARPVFDRMLAEENEEESVEEELEMAARDVEEESSVEIDLDSLSEREKRYLVERSTQELLKELDQIEERFNRVMARYR